MTGGLYLFLRGGRRSNLTSNSHDVLDFNSQEKWMRPLNVDWVGNNRTEHTYSASSFTSSDFGGPAKQDMYRPDVNGKMTGIGNAERNTDIEKEGWPGLPRPTGQERIASQQGSPFTQPQPMGDLSSLLPPTTYSPTMGDQPPSPKQDDLLLMPPPLFHPPEKPRHQRSSSVGSAQTVQIGLRLSNMTNDPPLPTVPPSFRASPLASPTAARTPPANRNSEGRLQEINNHKGLPPSPKSSPTTTQEGGSEGKTCQLSPTVYSPEASPKKPARTRLASPKGVGFQAAKPDRSGRNTPLASPRPPTSASPKSKTGRGWI